MKNNIFQGPFKIHIQNFIDVKQSIGYKYITEASILRRFDKFTIEKYSTTDVLTKEIVMKWCAKKTYEKQKNLCARASLIRQFAIYLDNLGHSAYVLPKNYFPSEEKYVPHIFTDIELQKFFHQTNNCQYCSQCPYRHLIMPIIFKMIYSCGLRVSEALFLKVGNVDLNTGILTILQSKNNNNRLVPMTDDLTKECQRYSKKVHCCSDSERYFFPMLDNKPLTQGNIYKNFRKFLWRAGISHRGRGFGPRIHDFRHSFAVHCLKKWSLEEKDLMTWLPVLSMYLGHGTFTETAYYLRLTAEVFPDITLKLEKAYCDLIPTLDKGGEYESK